MTINNAIAELPIYSGTEIPMPEELPRSHRREIEMERLKKRYGHTIAAIFIWGMSMILGCCLTGWIVHRNTDKAVRAEMEAHYNQMLADYHEQRQQEQAAEYFLSGDASREAFYNQEIDAVAPVIAKLGTDAQKNTELGCFIARHMNPAFPNSFKELAEQPQQWPLYDGKDRTYSQHDRDLTEAMLRPYLESGIIPSGLTDQMVYATWSSNDLVLRDSWEATSSMNTWRYQ